MFRAIFLDRDGVLIENRSEYVREWSHVKIFPEAIKALSRLHDYKVVIVTNQSAIGRGLISLEIADEINKQLIDVIKENKGKIDGVFMCPHAPSDQCNCRKPNPGLLLQAAKELSLDLSQSWMIGDAWSDLLAGKAAGVRGVVLLKTGRGNDQLSQPQPESLADYFVFNVLSQALTTIQNIDNASTNTP
jgi:D-glycero-D-manno-heptose 1,7-bisphosphate phosphatase